VDAAVSGIEAEYGVTVKKGVPAVAFRMAGDYLISRCYPKKAIELLAWTAADVAAEAEMRGSEERIVSKEDVAKQLASQTGLPVETILGTGADKDYAYLLSRQLVGQQAAVSKVAGRLDLIQKGMVDKKAPAAVFVFAGLSGTGKTELAKQIAQIYSSSRKLITFEMANFGESHSVSRLIGTPPGYVGYEEGGKLINDLNRDPYSVVLLDEIEKANPAIWDPFLNLFDEGAITDMRGITASGSKAFFVLTSNIGQYDITRMLREHCSMEEIEDAVMKKFTQEKHYKTHEQCFRPEFIGRIMRRGGIVVFNALSLDAMQGIARLMCRKIASDYAEVHDSKLLVDDDVIDMIAQTVYQENEDVIRVQGNGYFGGRRLDIMLDQFVKNKLAARLRQLASAPLVRIVRSGKDTEVVPVFGEGDAQALLRERRLALIDRVNRQFDRVVATPEGKFDDLSDEKLARLDSLLSEVHGMI
jgi:ATP-dependent Clp protease ATP-binding subunit ClpA